MSFLPSGSTLGKPSNFSRLMDGNQEISEEGYSTLRRVNDVIDNPHECGDGVREFTPLLSEEGFDTEGVRKLLADSAYGLIQHRERRRDIEWGPITDNMASLNRAWVEPLMTRIKGAKNQELGQLLSLFHYYALNGGGWALRIDATADDIDSVFLSLGWNFLVPDEQ